MLPSSSCSGCVSHVTYTSAAIEYWITMKVIERSPNFYNKWSWSHNWPFLLRNTSWKWKPYLIYSRYALYLAYQLSDKYNRKIFVHLSILLWLPLFLLNLNQMQREILFHHLRIRLTASILPAVRWPYRLKILNNPNSQSQISWRLL